MRGVRSVDQVGAEERAAALAKRSIKKASKLWALDLAIRCMDLTTLEGMDTPGKIAALCAKGIRPKPGDPTIPSVAAICIYPARVADAREHLGSSGVRVASVATAFPSGQSFLSLKIDETQQAVAAGADEVDMVIDRGAFLSGDYQKVYDEIVAIKEACGDAHLKVILETGELGTYDSVRRASILAMAAGADFIKTSTGKVQPAATLPVSLVMMDRQAGGVQAGRRHQDIQAGDRVPRRPVRDARPRVDDAGAVPSRRIKPLERCADADREGAQRRLPVDGLLHDRLADGDSKAFTDRARDPEIRVRARA